MLYSTTLLVIYFGCYLLVGYLFWLVIYWLSHPMPYNIEQSFLCCTSLKVLVHPFQVSSDCPHPEIHLWSSDCLRVLERLLERWWGVACSSFQKHRHWRQPCLGAPSRENCGLVGGALTTGRSCWMVYLRGAAGQVDLCTHPPES